MIRLHNTKVELVLIDPHHIISVRPCESASFGSYVMVGAYDLRIDETPDQIDALLKACAIKECCEQSMLAAREKGGAE